MKFERANEILAADIGEYMLNLLNDVSAEGGVYGSEIGFCGQGRKNGFILFLDATDLWHTRETRVSD